MKIKDIKYKPGDAEIKVNSVWDPDNKKLTPTECSGFYSEWDSTLYITPDLISLPNITDDQLTKEYVCAIIDVFENLLDRNNITIPDEDRTGEETEARIYGASYGELEEEITAILKNN